MSSYLSEDIKAVLFDHDDTLIGTIGSRWQHHKYVAHKYYNKELTDEEIIAHWGEPFSDLIRHLYETDDIEQALANNNFSRGEYPEPLFEGVVSMLQKLKEAKRLTGIITAANRSDFEQDLKRLHIPRELIDYTQTSDDTPYHKPNKRVFEPTLIWLAEIGVNPDKVVYIGDSLSDMKAAIGVGFKFIGVETGLVSAKQFKDAGAISMPKVSSLLPVI